MNIDEFCLSTTIKLTYFDGKKNARHILCNKLILPTKTTAATLILQNYQVNQKPNLLLYSPYHAEACNELRYPSPRQGAKVTRLPALDVEAVANRLQRCVRFGRPLVF